MFTGEMCAPWLESQGTVEVDVGTTLNHNNNNKLDRLMYYILLSGREMVELEDISYIWTNTITIPELMAVVHNDYSRRFTVHEENEHVYFGLVRHEKSRFSEKLKPGVAELAEKWRDEIYDHLKSIKASSALSVSFLYSSIYFSSQENHDQNENSHAYILKYT